MVNISTDIIMPIGSWKSSGIIIDNLDTLVYADCKEYPNTFGFKYANNVLQIITGISSFVLREKNYIVVEYTKTTD